MNIYCKVCGKELGYTFLGQICFECHRKLVESEKLDKERDDRLLIQKCEKEKIEFAIEQLEKAKDKILGYEEIYYQALRNGATISVFCVETFRVRQNIDKQIKELKKGVN